MQLARRGALSLFAIQALLILTLVAGWASVLGTIWRSVADGTHALSLPATLVPQASAAAALPSAGTHTLGSAGSATATFRFSGGELLLLDVAPSIFFGVRLLEVLSSVTVVLALHLVDRILRTTAEGQPFSRTNGRRCLRIGLWLLVLCALEIGRYFAHDALAASTEIRGAWAPTIDGGEIIGSTTLQLLLVLMAFAAAAVIHYGCDLEDERSLTV